MEMTQVLVFARDVANARELKAGLENANYGVRIVRDEAKALDVVDNMAPAAVLVLAAGEERDPLRFAEQLADEAAPGPALVLIVNRADRDRAEAIADETRGLSAEVALWQERAAAEEEEKERLQAHLAELAQVILPTAPAASNEGGSSPLLALVPAVSWPWVPAWGSLEPPRRDGENAQKNEKKRGINGRDTA